MGAAAGWEWDLDSVLYALVWNTCGEVRAQHIVSGRQEAVMMWAKKDLAKDQSECRETLERQSEGECSQRNASHVHINMCARSLLNLNAITCLYQQKLQSHYFSVARIKYTERGEKTEEVDESQRPFWRCTHACWNVFSSHSKTKCGPQLGFHVVACMKKKKKKKPIGVGEHV